MEKQNTEGNNQMKKTLIICGSILAVAVIAIVCIILLTNQNQNQNEVLNDGMVMDPSEMTFEEFCMGMKKDLPQETMDEVKRLYDELQKAQENNQIDRVSEIFEELNQLDVYDFGNSGVPLEVLDLSELDSGALSSGGAIKIEGMKEK